MKLSQGSKRINVKRKVEPLKKKVERPKAFEEGTLQEAFASAGEEIKGIHVTHKEKEKFYSKALQQKRELPELEITDVIFNVFSHEELEKLSAYDVKNTNLTGHYSVNDPRGGTVDFNTSCSLCNLDNENCPGHFGIIRLNEKIIHPLFRNELVDVLTSVCSDCGGLLLSKDIIKNKYQHLDSDVRLKEIANASRGLPCIKKVKDAEEGIKPCSVNPYYSKDKLKETGKIYYSREKKSKTAENFLQIEHIHKILNDITVEDANILGFTGDFSHPKRFIMESITVIPLCSRPQVIQDGEESKDDLTSMYLDIVRINLDLEKNKSELERENKVKSLIWHIEHMFDNSDKTYGPGNVKKYQSIKERVQGKGGLVRLNIMGKRVNYSARTVIGPDPTLKFGQIRVPRTMASSLTQHEIITPENIDKMTSLLRSGRITHITPSEGRISGQRIKVNKKHETEHILVIGDEVDRWLENGDWVVFNRQPTLHKQGMMGFEVVLGEALTIGVHLGVTRQFNAD